MATTSLLSPGVYIEEVSTGVRPIEGVSTSTAAFLGQSMKGPINAPSLMNSWQDYVAKFVADDSVSRSPMDSAVQTFFDNGGGRAYVVRLASGSEPSRATLTNAAGQDVIDVDAVSPGEWGNAYSVKAIPNGEDFAFEVGHIRKEVRRKADGTEVTVEKFVVDESFSRLSLSGHSPYYFKSAVNGVSRIVNLSLVKGVVFQQGRSVSADHDAKETKSNLNSMVDSATEMTLDLSVDGMGRRSVTISEFDAMESLAAEIQDLVAALGDEAGYANFTAKYDSLRLTLQSGSGKEPWSSVVVYPGDVAKVLKLGVAAGGTETHGSQDLVPTTRELGDPLAQGRDGGAPDQGAYRTALAMLEQYRDISILLLPGQPMDPDGKGNLAISAAIAHCEKTQNRMVIIDPPPGKRLEDKNTIDLILPEQSSYAVMYYPWLLQSALPSGVDGADGETNVAIAPSAAAAGVWARTDARRGVWKAPAGMEAHLAGASRPQFRVGAPEQEDLNPIGVNAIRRQNGGMVLWGARTLATSSNPEWRYLPVRRMAIFIERSIYDGIQWAVFEPNGEALWSSLRLNVEAFLNGLFRVGAFQGARASEAYRVRCGLGQTMTKDDIDRGYAIVEVGFAPLNPSEFVVVKIATNVDQQQR